VCRLGRNIKTNEIVIIISVVAKIGAIPAVAWAVSYAYAQHQKYEYKKYRVFMGAQQKPEVDRDNCDSG
jgi:hypothetical protein